MSFKKRRFSKKASLEISIQAIVIVVLALTLLGLGLVFIRKQFAGLTGINEEISDQIRNKLREDLITGDKKVAFPQTKLEIGKGEAEILAVGVRNKKDSPLNFKMRFTPISDPFGNPFSIESPQWFQFAQGTTTRLAASDSDIKQIRLSVPRGTPAGSYFLTFEVIDDDLAPPDNIYASGEIFIIVRG